MWVKLVVVVLPIVLSAFIVLFLSSVYGVPKFQPESYTWFWAEVVAWFALWWMAFKFSASDDD